MLIELDLEIVRVVGEFTERLQVPFVFLQIPDSDLGEDEPPLLPSVYQAHDPLPDFFLRSLAPLLLQHGLLENLNIIVVESEDGDLEEEMDEVDMRVVLGSLEDLSNEGYERPLELEVVLNVVQVLFIQVQQRKGLRGELLVDLEAQLL